MSSKLIPMQEAVDRFVHDGDSLVIEGFTHLICFAAAHGFDCVIECGAGEGLKIRAGICTGLVAIGTKLSLECDFLRHKRALRTAEFKNGRLVAAVYLATGYGKRIHSPKSVN